MFLTPDLTIEEQLQRDFPNESIGSLRSLAGAFQFSGEDIDKKIRALSGGEKTRLVMARMLLNPPNFLVLDEPTNHLDLATKEMLIEALKEFDGTMLFVSHDREFLRGFSNRVLELGGETGTDADPHVYPGSYGEYVVRTGPRSAGRTVTRTIQRAPAKSARIVRRINTLIPRTISCLFDIDPFIQCVGAAPDAAGSHGDRGNVHTDGDIRVCARNAVAGKSRTPVPAALAVRTMESDAGVAPLGRSPISCRSSVIWALPG